MNKKNNEGNREKIDRKNKNTMIFKFMQFIIISEDDNNKIGQTNDNKEKLQKEHTILSRNTFHSNVVHQLF